MYWVDTDTGTSAAPTPPSVISPTKKFFTEGDIGEQPTIPGAFWFNMVQEELLGVLTLAGLTPDKSDLNQVSKAIQSIAFSAYPVGAPIPWPTAVPPSGFLAMTGQAFSPTTYPRLALAYPSLILPDMRAEFIRGWDNSRGIDPSRALLSLQLDALQNFGGGFNDVVSGGSTGPGTGPFSVSTAVTNLQTLSTGGVSQRVNIVFDAQRAARTANETRSRSVSFNYIVRAA